MFGKVLSAACLAAVFGATSAFADLKGPAELPPAGYKGQQYVDSRGCVFLRAGYGGQVTWVPRVSRDRKQLCGYPESGGSVDVAAEAPAAAPEPEVAAAPAAKAAPKAEVKVVEAPAVKAAPKVVTPDVTVAAAPKVIERPVTPTERAATAPEVVGSPADVGGADGFRLACPADTPVAERFEIRGGGSKLMCTRGDGSLDGANFPVLVAGSTAGYPTGYDAWVAAGNDPKEPGPAPGGTVYAGGSDATIHAGTKSAKYPDVTPPPGYKLAWKDDRLNPNRGKQTVDGFLQMDEIWTRTTPSELREDFKGKQRPVKVIVRRGDGTTYEKPGVVVTQEDGSEQLFYDTSTGGTTLGLTASTKSDPKAEVAPKAPAKAVAKAVAKPVSKAEPKVATKEKSGKAKAAPEAGDLRLLVQVGTFGVKSNADKVVGRLRGLGLPVALSKRNGGDLTIVFAGPFGSASEAKAALSAARGAGFGDAVIVQ